MTSSAAVEPINPPELPASQLISQAVVLRDLRLVFVSGQLPWNAQRELVGRGDLAAQYAKANENVDAVLRAAGTSRANIVKETIYIVGYTPDRAPKVLELLAASRQGRPGVPASTIVGVSSLVGEGVLVEIEAVATLPADPVDAL